MPSGTLHSSGFESAGALGNMTPEDADSLHFGAMSAIIMVLGLALITMGVMDYYANDFDDDEEQYPKYRTKQGLLGQRSNNDPESMSSPQPDRVAMVAGLTNEGAGTGPRDRRHEFEFELNEDAKDGSYQELPETFPSSQPSKPKKKKDGDESDKFDKV